MSDPIGFVVVTCNQASGQPDLDTCGMHLYLDDAEYEREVLAAQTAESGRGERHFVCAVVPVSEGEQ